MPEFVPPAWGEPGVWIFWPADSDANENCGVFWCEICPDLPEQFDGEAGG